VKQLGGGFGGKLTRGNFAATAAAVAANSLNLPVKVLMDLNDCMVFYFIVFQTVF
jgi:xanthine dehydrogenase molybdopterin-binding subunit B